jgi:hypothetical protein
MQEKIQETTNYELFELDQLNRDVKRILPLMDSMHAHGFISAYPLHVTKGKRGKLKIKAGHHRFIAAKSVGIPVKFVVCDDESTIHELERSSQKWTLEDYLTSYVRANNPAYHSLKLFKEQSGLSTRSCLYLLTGQVYNGGKGADVVDSFKDGNFKVTSAKLAYWVSQLVKFAQKGNFPGATHYIFVVALSKAFIDGRADYKQLKKQLSSWGHSIRLSSNVEDYVREIERLYNFRNRKKLPIAYLIEGAESSRRRKKDSSHV